MKAFSVENERKSEQDSDTRNQKKAVAERYKRLIKGFDCYFPHMPVPRIAVEPSGKCFYIKIKILDTVIEMEKSYHRLHPALHSILQVGIDFVDRYGMYMVKNLASDDEEPKKEIDSVSVGSSHFADRQNSSTTNCHVKKGKDTSTKETSESKTALDGCIDDIHREFQESGENAEAFYNLVKNHCTSRGICLPEYVIEKENGVFMCRADFASEKFTSRYAYSKDGAKEDVFRMICKFIQEKEKYCRHNSVEIASLQHQDIEKLLTERTEKVSNDIIYRTSDTEKIKRKKTHEAELFSDVGDASQNTAEHVFADDCSMDSTIFTEIRRDDLSGCLLYINVHGKGAQKSQTGEKRKTKESENLHVYFREASAKKTFGFGDIFDSE